MSHWAVHLYQPDGAYPDLHLVRPCGTLAASRRRITLSACCQAIDYWIGQNLTGQDAKAARAAIADLMTTTRESTTK